MIINIADSLVYWVEMEGDDMIVKGHGVFHRLEGAPGYLRDYVSNGCFVSGFFDDRVFVIQNKVVLNDG